MIIKIASFVIGVFLIANIYGCVALVAGAAGGTGTAVWLSDKITEEVNVPFARAIKATEAALRSLHLEVTKETKKDDVAQIMSKYTDGKTIWIDIRPVTPSASRIDVRVGIKGDEAAARKIMQMITRYL